MSDKEKKVFVKPELIKFDKPLDEVTLSGCGTGYSDAECAEHVKGIVNNLFK